MLTSRIETVRTVYYKDWYIVHTLYNQNTV